MEIDIEQIKEKLIDKLRPSGWATALRGFIYSHQFDDLILSLQKRVKEEEKRFTPPLKDVFSALEDCPFDKVKVIIIGQDPYPQKDVADGKAFSCSKTSKEQPSLTFMLDEIERQTKTKERPTDLKIWAEQGVLLLNAALTCDLGKPGTHYKIWQPFLAYLLDVLNHSKKKLAFIYMGKTAATFAPLVTNYEGIFTTHPVTAGYSGSGHWDGNNCFNRANEKIEKKIIW